MSDDSPYLPPKTESQPAGYTSKTHLILLPLQPWRLLEVAETSRPSAAIAVGLICWTIQVGGYLAVSLSSISEPYRNTQQCIGEVLNVVLPVMAFVALLIVMPSVTIIRYFPEPTNKVWLLAPWATMAIFVGWLICHFCAILDAPNYGIINDDRPTWMTHPFVLRFGRLECWLLVTVLALLVAGAKRRWKSRI